MLKRANGPSKRVATAKAHEPKESKRETTAKARARVLQAAILHGHVTHNQARKLGKWDQAWYHLNAMRDAGQLVQDEYNRWRPAPPKKKRKRAKR
jgi:hypothetical protein